MYSRFWKRVTEILEASVVGRLYLRIVHVITGAFHNSWIYNFFSSKDMVLFGNAAKIPGAIRKTFFESKLADFISESMTVWLFSEYPEQLIASPISVISAYLLPSGALAFISFFGDVKLMLATATVILIGVCLLRFRSPIGQALNNSLILGGMCRFLEIKTDLAPNDKNTKVYLIAGICGAAVGGLTFTLSLKLCVAAFLFFLLFPLMFSSPIFMITICLFAGMSISTLPATMVAVLLLIMVLCRLYKGKEHLPPLRAVYVMVLLYTALTLYYTFCGFGGGDGVLAGVIQFIFLTVFFSLVVVINTKDKLKKLICSISVCTLYTSLLGIYQMLTGQGGTGWANDDDYVGGLRRISSTFANPNVYGEFLVIAIAIIITAILISRTMKQRVLFALFLGLCLVNLGLTYSRGCYIAVLLSVLIIIWCCDKRLLGFGIFAIPILPRIIPKNVVSRLLSVGSYFKDSSIMYRFSIWRGSLRIIKNHWFVGSGIGVASFTAFYRQYMLSGVTAQHSHNVFMQIAIELSMIGLILFLAIFIFLLRDICYNVRARGSIDFKFAIIPIASAFVGILVEGFVDYLFYNNIVFLIFWIALGLVVAGLNTYGNDYEVNAAVQKGESI